MFALFINIKEITIKNMIIKDIKIEKVTMIITKEGTIMRGDNSTDTMTNIIKTILIRIIEVIYNKFIFKQAIFRETKAMVMIKGIIKIIEICYFYMNSQFKYFI